MWFLWARYFYSVSRSNAWQAFLEVFSATSLGSIWRKCATISHTMGSFAGSLRGNGLQYVKGGRHSRTCFKESQTSISLEIRGSMKGALLSNRTLSSGRVPSFNMSGILMSTWQTKPGKLVWNTDKLLDAGMIFGPWEKSRLFIQIL